MKYILSALASATFLLFSVVGFHRYQDYRLQIESADSQTERLTKELWKIQKQFGLSKFQVTVHSAREVDMDNCGCWGSTEISSGPPIILIIRTQDMPSSIPQTDRIAFQNEILQHEVMHIVLTSVGVPSDFQDTLIHRLQPSMIKP